MLELINGPITTHLPPNGLKIGTSVKGHLVPDLEEYMNENQIAKSMNPKLQGTQGRPLVFVIGCSSHGNFGGHQENDYLDDCISISNYGLSSQCVAQKVCFAAEEIWNIVGV